VVRRREHPWPAVSALTAAREKSGRRTRDGVYLPEHVIESSRARDSDVGRERGQVYAHVPLHGQSSALPPLPRVVVLRDPMRTSTREQLMRDGVKPGEYTRRDQPSVAVHHACGERAC
jgi:hypothetical protein